MPAGEKDIIMEIFKIGFVIAIAIAPGVYLGLLLCKYSQRFSIAMALIYCAGFLLGWNIMVMN